MHYDKDNIDPAIIKKVKPYLERDDFTPEAVYNSSQAAGGICKWAHAMVVYDETAKVVAPKRQQLATAEAEFEAVMVGLRSKQAQLKEVEERLAALGAKLAGCVDTKKSLELQVNDCVVKLERAEKLISGLGGEKVRWTEAADTLHQRLSNVTGDILLSAGVIAYLAPSPACTGSAPLPSGWPPPPEWGCRSARRSS